MYNNLNIGQNAAGIFAAPAFAPISKIAVLVDDENEYVSGDDTGRTLEVTCPYGNQTMADDLLAQLKGYAYQPMTAQDALLDPAAEIGDGVTVGGVSTTLAQIDTLFDMHCAADIAAPGEEELESEYAFQTQEKRLERKLAQTRSLIAKNSEGVQILVERTNGLDEQYASFGLALDEIALTVSGINRDVTALELRADGIEASVQSVQTGLGQTVRLAADGLTITNAAGSKLTIDGGQVNAENLNLTGRITFNDLNQNVKNRFGDGLTEDDIYTYIDDSLVSSPTIAGGVFMDYDQEVSLYLDATRDGSSYGLILEDDAGEIFTIWSDRRFGEVASISLRGFEFLSNVGGTIYAWGEWDFSNANVIGL